MVKPYLFLIFVILSLGTSAKEKTTPPRTQVSRSTSAPEMNKIPAGITYFQKFFGHVHQDRSPYSASLTTISCGHPLKAFSLESSASGEKIREGGDWEMVEAGGFEGYVLKKYLGPERPTCFQKKYQHFFNNLELDLTEMYFWGKLYDQYIFVKTEVK